MPVYVYEVKPPAKGCAQCRGGFEKRESLADAPTAVCPECGSPVFRVIQAPALGRSQTDLHYRAKRAGFKMLKKVQRGEYEAL